MRQRRALNGTELSTLAWAFSRLGHYHPGACEALASAACRCVRYMPPGDLSAVLAALAALRFSDEALLGQLHRSCLRDAHLAVDEEEGGVGSLQGPDFSPSQVLVVLEVV